MSERTKHLIATRARSGPVGGRADNGVTLAHSGRPLLTARRSLAPDFRAKPRAVLSISKAW